MMLHGVAVDARGAARKNGWVFDKSVVSVCGELALPQALEVRAGWMLDAG